MLFLCTVIKGEAVWKVSWSRIWAPTSREPGKYPRCTLCLWFKLSFIYLFQVTNCYICALTVTISWSFRAPVSNVWINSRTRLIPEISLCLFVIGRLLHLDMLVTCPRACRLRFLPSSGPVWTWFLWISGALGAGRCFTAIIAGYFACIIIPCMVIVR